jgi:tetratricopeptide (TPR) repeat protein
MKAEHRKELQTNALADRIGRFFQNLKSSRPSNLVILWCVLGAVVIGLGAAWWLMRRSNTNAQSDAWVNLDTVSAGIPDLPPDPVHAAVDPYKKTVEDLEEIIEQDPGSKQATFARFRIAQIHLRQRGLDLLAQSPAVAVTNLALARKEYEKLAEDFKKDPYWGPDALLGIAQITETMALEDLNNLDKAQKLYQELADNYKDSAAGKEAAKRLTVLKNKGRRKEIEEFYKDLRNDPSFFMLRK